MCTVTLFRDLPDSSEMFLSRLETVESLPEEPLRMLSERYAVKNELDLARRAAALAGRRSSK
jgi:hypothetical protein